MNRIKIWAAALISASLIYCGGSDHSHRPDPLELVKKDPDHTRVLLDNEYGAMLLIQLPPGAEQPEHYGSARIVYSLNDYSLDWQEGSAESQVDWKAGDVHEHRPGLHRARNTGSSEARYLIVLRKDGPLDPVESLKAPSRFHREILKTDSFVVFEVNLPAGQSIPAHQGFPRFVYSLTDYRIEYTEGEEEGTHSFKQGDVHFHSSSKEHSASNIGESEGRFLVVVPRK